MEPATVGGIPSKDHGFGMWGTTTDVCRQCHGPEPTPNFEELHSKHVEDMGFDCSWCHGFSRSERGLTPTTTLFREDFASGNTFAWASTSQW